MIEILQQNIFPISGKYCKWPCARGQKCLQVRVWPIFWGIGSAIYVPSVGGLWGSTRGQTAWAIVRDYLGLNNTPPMSRGVSREVQARGHPIETCWWLGAGSILPLVQVAIDWLCSHMAFSAHGRVGVSGIPCRTWCPLPARYGASRVRQLEVGWGLQVVALLASLFAV